MPAIDMPASPNFVSSRFGPETNSQVFTSPLTKATQRLLQGGTRRMFTGTLPHMTRAQAAEWKAFFDKLEGMVNTFNGFDPDCKTPRGPMSGTPLVKGGSETGSSLDIDGCTANVIGWGLKGDYFVVNSELKRLTANANTYGSGETTLSFKPALRSSPADNAPLTVQNATCLMILQDDMQGIWECNANGIYLPKTFTAIEVFS